MRSHDILNREAALVAGDHRRAEWMRGRSVARSEGRRLLGNDINAVSTKVAPLYPYIAFLRFNGSGCLSELTRFRFEVT